MTSVTSVAPAVLRTRPSWKTAALAALLAFLSSSLHADSVIAGTQIEEVVREINARQEKIQTLRAHFRQEKSLALLNENVVSEGTFVFEKPNQVLWVYEKPTPVTMLITGGWMTTWYPEIRKAERLEIRRFEDRIFRYMGAVGGAMEDLGRYFNFRFTDTRSEPSYVLELTPKTRTLERRVRKITVWIDRETYITNKFEYVEGDGDTTRYEFFDIRINARLEDDTFDLNLPADVRVEQIKMNR